MPRNFYTFGIYLAIICTVVGLIQTVFYFSVGRQLFVLDAFRYWYLAAYAATILLSIVILKYFRSRGFTISFWAALIFLIVSLFQFVVVYGSLSGVQAFVPFYFIAHVIVAGLEIGYALTLIFSNAGKQVWLKIAGYVALLCCIVLLAVWAAYSTDTSGVANLEALEQTHQWVSLALSLIPGMFALNFFSELRQSAYVAASTRGQVDTIGMAIVALSLLFLLVTGSALATETFSQIRWQNQLSRMAEEWRQTFESRTFTGSNDASLSYQLLEPENFDPQRKYPLFVGLPYNGGVEGCPPVQWLLSPTNREKYPAFLFVPFCPEGAGWGGVPNTPAIDTLVFECIRALEKEFAQIDTERIYVSGVSRGGYGSWHFIGLAPDMFAAAVPVCGGGDPDLGQAMKDVAVWAFHGEDDKNVPVELSRNMIAAMERAGAQPRYTEYDGEGHNIWDKVKSTQGLLDWLFSQRNDQSAASQN